MRARALLPLTLALLPGAAIAWWLDPQAGALASLLLVLGLLVRHLLHLHRLLHWLGDPEQALPGASGTWDEVFSLLYRRQREARAERERVQAELGRFRSLGNAMPDGVVILDVAGHIEWCNPTAERFFDIDARRDAGRPLLNLVRAPDLAAFLQADRPGDPLVLRVARGDAPVLSMRVIPYGHEQKLLLARDVTQAERIAAMRRDFVANVSHELKTPLTVVHGFVETLQDPDLPLGEARRAQVLGLMRQQTDRMLQLIDDLLALSALESAPPLAADNQVALAPLLLGLCAEAQALSGGRHEIGMHVDQGAALLGEEKELRSAFGNLLSNAIRYTPAGGRIGLHWRIRPEGTGEFSVTDSGIGIDSSHLPRLTERFYRVDRSRSRETGGTGLGLAIVKHVLNRHQAVLEIRSQPGEGSCFMAVFPPGRLAPSGQVLQKADRAPAGS